MAKPKLRFPEFMDEWEEKRVSEIFEFTNGKAHEQNVDENGKYIIVNSKFISTEGKVKKYTNDLICPLKKNDIVMVMSDVPNGRAISKCFLIQEDDKYTLNQRICGLRTNQNSIFYIHQISRNKYYLKFDNGVSQTNLRKEDVINCPIFETTDNEQQKIADFLSKIDEKIANQEVVVSDYEEMKKDLMQKIFRQEVRFKAEDGSEYPEWEEKRLGECLLIQRGGSPRPIDSYMTNKEDGINWIKIGDAPIDGNIITSAKEKIKPEGKIKSREVFAGDLILSNSMSFGRPYILNIDGCIHDGWLLLRDEKKLFDLKYLCYLLSSDSVLSQYKKYAAGSTVNNLNIELVKAVKISYLSKEEQQKIANCLSAMDKKIEAEKKILEDWKELKKALLQQMFV